MNGHGPIRTFKTRWSQFDRGLMALLLHELRRIADAAERLAGTGASQKATKIDLAALAIPREGQSSSPDSTGVDPMAPTTNVSLGNFFFDLNGILLTMNANGTIDGPGVITSSPADGNGLRLVRVDDTHVKIFADADVSFGTITITDDVDDPKTVDIKETISRTAEFSFSHSKATTVDLAGTAIPREEPAGTPRPAVRKA